MLINTYNGRVYRLEEMLALLNGAGLKKTSGFLTFNSDTSYCILAKPDRAKRKPALSRPWMLAASGKALRVFFRPHHRGRRE